MAVYGKHGVISRGGSFGSVHRTYESGDLYSYLDNLEQKIYNTIQNESENYILNVNETEYIGYLKDEYTLDAPVLHFNEVYAESPREELIPAEYFPFSFNVVRGKSYPRPVITFCIPYSGNIKLLKYRPSRWLSVGVEFLDNGDCLCLDYIQFYDDNIEPIKQEFENDKRRLQDMINFLEADINNWNSKLQAISKT